MAEAPEEIIIIEESEAAEFNQEESTNLTPEDDEAAKKKKILIFGGLAIAVVLIIVITLLLVLVVKKKEKPQNIDLIEEKLSTHKPKPIEPSKLEQMIVKANYLYSSGSKEDALALYEQIAQYSETISLYNLGVAQMKNEQYSTALETFKKAITNDEKRCVSAINAAVCALHLHDEKTFHYYIDLAHAYLPYEVDAPLYSYYYTLIAYYKQNYLEALSSLKNKTSSYYPHTQKDLMAKLSALYGNNYDAIEAMENGFEDMDDLSIALLYARIGDFTLAINHLNEALIKNIDPVRSQLALGLVKLKAGRVSEAAKEIKNVTDMFPDDVYKYYPIRIKLKESLFDPKKAQKFYREDIIKSDALTYQKIFYFSPYKIYNANQTISYIRKGTANIYIDNVNSAKKYLKHSASSSSVNYGITKAIKMALSFHLRQANEEFQKLLKIQPKHSILHYNLALTYAQMGNLNLAYKHFLRSYHLDAKNYLSGIYAMMTGKILHHDTSKLTSILKDALYTEEDSEDKELYLTLIHLAEHNYLSAVDWLDHNYKPRPLYLMLNILIATKLDKHDLAKKASEQLTTMLPRDILPHMIYIDTHFYEYNDTKYATSVIRYLKDLNLQFNDLYYGPYISRYLYIQQNLITGQLYYLREQLKKMLEATQGDTKELLSSLAMASLYDKAYEESYSLYNTLIDEQKVRDSYTLFLGAVASTAAGHHANAIALLELSKMKDKTFTESRYALGLLYLEVQNNEGASIQFSFINNDAFHSKYFDFVIDEQKLLQKKNLAEVAKK